MSLLEIHGIVNIILWLTQILRLTQIQHSHIMVMAET